MADLVTYKEAAQMLGGVKPELVRRLGAKGLIRVHAISTRVHRVDADSVREYLRRSVIQPPLPRQSGKITTRIVTAPGAGRRSFLDLLEQKKEELRQETRKRRERKD